MFNKFKNNEFVIVTGIGKCNGQKYINCVGRVVCRDPFFLDYNIEFIDGTEDWLDGKYLSKLEG